MCNSFVQLPILSYTCKRPGIDFITNMFHYIRRFTLKPGTFESSLEPRYIDECRTSSLADKANISQGGHQNLIFPKLTRFLLEIPTSH